MQLFQSIRAQNEKVFKITAVPIAATPVCGSQTAMYNLSFRTKVRRCLVLHEQPLPGSLIRVPGVKIVQNLPRENRRKFELLVTDALGLQNQHQRLPKRISRSTTYIGKAR